MAMVLQFSEPLFHEGYTLQTNNCPTLAKFLKSHKTQCGDHQNRIMKKLQGSKQQKCKAAAQHSGPVCILSEWDKKHVTVISTYNTDGVP